MSLFKVAILFVVVGGGVVVLVFVVVFSGGGGGGGVVVVVGGGGLAANKNTGSQSLSSFCDHFYFMILSLIMQNCHGWQTLALTLSIVTYPRLTAVNAADDKGTNRLT